MKFYGNVAGIQHDEKQQLYDEPIDSTRRCKWCGHKFAVPRGSGRHTYCSAECRAESLREQRRKASLRYQRKVSRGKAACA